MAKKNKFPKAKRIELKSPQMKAFLKRVKERSLAEEDYEIIQGMAETLQCLNQALEEKTTSIKRLLRYLFGAPTETAQNVLPKKNPTPPISTPQEKPKRKGHGRNGASSYTGGSHVAISHPSLQVGDDCPVCYKGKVYRLSLPSVVVRIVGNAPLHSTVYELE